MRLSRFPGKSEPDPPLQVTIPRYASGVRPTVHSPQSAEASTRPNGQTVEADGVSFRPPVRLRLWPVVTVVGLALPLLVGTATLAAWSLAFLEGDGSGWRDEATLRRLSRTRFGFLVTVILPQFVMVSPAIIAALCSPRGLIDRLSLRRGHWPLWAWAAAALTTPLIAMTSGLITTWIFGESDGLRRAGDLFQSVGQGGFAVVVALAIGMTPAICEELLFRGYAQTRLLRMMPAWIAVGLTAIIFAAFHMDPVHAVAVFPLGLYLGGLVRHSGSIFPAMLAHFANNSISVALLVSSPRPVDGELPLPPPAVLVAILAVLATSFFSSLATIYAFVNFPPIPPGKFNTPADAAPTADDHSG